jgi:S1-C subfamily serine protease
VRGTTAVALLVVALGLGGCALGGSIDDFIDNPGPSRTRPATGGKLDARRIYRATERSVVTVIVDLDGDGLAEGLGSGFATGPAQIVTNVHVIGNLFNHKKAEDVYVQTRDGSRYPALIVGTDSHADVAVLSVDYSDPEVAEEASDVLWDDGLDTDEELGLETPRLKPVRFGDSAELAVGDPVAAVGAPLGITDSLAVGYVTGVDRTIRGLAGFSIPGAIQTDAAITLGNSGGPLLNAKGEVVGINDQIATVGGGGEGLAFAIPSETVERSVREILRDGKVEYAYLGARTRPVPPTLRSSLGLPDDPGVIVFSTREGSPARLAGLRGDEDVVALGGSEWPENGDFITAVDDRPLRENERLTTALARYRPGQKVTLHVARCCYGSDQGYRSRTVTVLLGERPLLWDEQ